jgi:hypothetical protein
MDLVDMAPFLEIEESDSPEIIHILLLVFALPFLFFYEELPFK